MEKINSENWQSLINIMTKLRAENGCPWDREQDHFSLKKYLLEETYEVLDAIDAKNDVALCDELGDVLLQVVFHAQIAAEQGRFTIDDVVNGISNKMIRRHPHVFGTEHANNSGEVLTMWEEIKAAEKVSNGNASEKRGLMCVNDNLPSLIMAQKVQDKASRVGFDWPDIEGPKAKLTEEINELYAAETWEEKRDEMGDCFFALVNLARFLNVDAEDSLRHTVKKFMARFDYIEQKINEQGGRLGETSLAELDRYWDEAKEKGI